jgi:STE24 endopeptidase
MPFIYLLLFALICLQGSWPAPRIGLTEQGSAILVGTMVVASWLSAGLIAQVLSWQLIHQHDQRSALMRRYGRLRKYHFIGLLIAYLTSLYALGWGHVLHHVWLEWTPSHFAVHDTGNLPGYQIAVLLPFLAALLLGWERFYHFEKTAYELAHESDHFMSRTAYLIMQVRHQFYLVVPPILLLLLQQLLFGLFPHLHQEESYVPAVIALSMIAAAFILMPLLLRIFLGLQPLPVGPLRDRLEAAARRLGFRYSNVLIWHTRGLFANAMVTGIVPWIRYIVLTDRLIEELTPDEIEAVFGHEVGHIKHHHLIFYLIFFLTSFIVLSLFWDATIGWLTSYRTIVKVWVGDEIWSATTTFSGFGKLMLLAGYTLLCFGFISRRCERQADLFGSKTVSTDAFISALEKVAYINGIPRDRSGNWLLSWQHPTIAQRIDFLIAMRDRPERVAGFHRSVYLLQIGFLSLLGAILWYFELPDVLKLLMQP